MRNPSINHTHDCKGHSHPYLTPLTGHELAFFPPTNPATFEREPLSTSAYFRHKKSAFFDWFNRKMVRGRMEIDLTCALDEKNGHGIGKVREPAGNYSGPHAYQPMITSSCQATHYPCFKGCWSPVQHLHPRHHRVTSPICHLNPCLLLTNTVHRQFQITPLVRIQISNNVLIKFFRIIHIKLGDIQCHRQSVGRQENTQSVLLLEAK